MTDCPSDARLAEYLADALDPSANTVLESHCDGCSRCQSRLALLSGDDFDFDSRSSNGGWRMSSRMSARLLADIAPSRPTVAGAVDASVALLDLPEDELPTIPGLQVLRELGRGGMGVVYEARQTDLGRRVAVKILRPDVRESGMVSRFRQEAETVARLNHPNVVPIHAVGEWSGRPYLVLELVAGGSLADRLREGPLSPAVAAAVVEPIARAVEYTHRAGIIHRDLKPGNILLSASAAGVGSTVAVLKGGTDPAIAPPDSATTAPLVPKVTDFGLARLTEVPGHFTRTGVVMGTPNYMAPEQTRGDPNAVTASADVYAIGAILYETLTGRPPFAGPTAMDTLFAVVSTEPVPPRRLNPSVPRDLETISLKCLEKVPHRRYASAEGVADDLARYLRKEPILARPLSRVGRAMKWAQRNPWVAALLSGLIALAVTSVIVFASLWWDAVRAEGHARDEEGKAKVKEQEAKDERKKAVDAADDLAKELAAGKAREYSRLIALAAQYLRAGTATDAARALDACPPAHRRAEWDMLSDWAAHTCYQLEMSAVPGNRIVAGDPSGRFVAVLDFDTTTNPAVRPDGRRMPHVRVVLRLFDTNTGKVARRTEMPDGFYNGLRFLADGRLLAVEFEGSRRTVWDAATGETAYEIDGETVTVLPKKDGGAWPSAVAHGFSADGRILVWQLGAKPRTLSPKMPPQHEVRNVELSPNGAWVGVVGDPRAPGEVGPNKAVILVGPADGGAPLKPLVGTFGTTTSNRLAFSPDAALVSVADRDGIVRVFDVKTCAVVGVVGGGDLSDPMPLAFDPTGTVLAVASRLKPVVELWTAGLDYAPSAARRWNRVRMVQRWQLSEAGAAWFLTDGRLAECGRDGRGTVWHRPRGIVRELAGERGARPIREIPPPPFATVAAHPDDARFLAVASSSAEMFDTGTGRRVTAPGTPIKPVLSVIAGVRPAGPGGKALLLRQNWTPGGLKIRPALQLWDTARNRFERTLEIHDNPVVAFGGTADRAVALCEGGTVRSWSLAADEPPTEWKVPLPDGSRAAFSSDAANLFVAAWDEQKSSAELVVYDTVERTEKRRVPLDGWFGPLADVVPVGDDRVALVGGRDASAGVQVRSAVTRALVVELPTTSRTAGVTATADGRRILTVSGSQLRLWDADTGFELLTLPDPPTDVNGAAISADGRTVVAQGALGGVRVWGEAAKKK